MSQSRLKASFFWLKLGDGNKNSLSPAAFPYFRCRFLPLLSLSSLLISFRTRYRNINNLILHSKTYARSALRLLLLLILCLLPASRTQSDILGDRTAGLRELITLSKLFVAVQKSPSPLSVSI